VTDLEMLREAARLMRAAADSRWSAVANWLSDTYSYHAPIWRGPHVPSDLAHALAVARAYLRREP